MTGRKRADEEQQGRTVHKTTGRSDRRTIYGGERDEVSEEARATSQKRLSTASACVGTMVVGRGKRGRKTSTYGVRLREREMDGPGGVKKRRRCSLAPRLIQRLGKEENQAAYNTSLVGYEEGADER